MLSNEIEPNLEGFLLESENDLGVLGEIMSYRDQSIGDDSASDLGDIIDDDLHLYIDVPIMKRKRKEYYSETKHKKFRDMVPEYMPPIEDYREVGTPVRLEKKTSDSFIRGNLKRGEIKYNFILAVAFGMAGDFSYLLHFHPNIDLPLITEMLRTMVSDYMVYNGDGYKDIIVRRKSLNDIFATVTNNEPTNVGIHSKIITRIICGREAIRCKGSNGVTQGNIRAVFTFFATYNSRYGIKYLVDKDDTDEFFQFRIGI